MTTIETIEGDSVRDLFEELKEDKTLITLKLVDKRFEKLTLLTGFRRRFSRTYFLLDCPEGFQEAVSRIKTWHLKFQFTGKDHVQHSFSTKGGEFYKDQLCIELPARVNRHQRRKNFRLKVPEGSTIEFKIKETERREKVLDVSLGGALVALVYFTEEDVDQPPFKAGDTLEDIELTFPSELGEKRINVKTASVVRVDDGLPEAKICCGLQFGEIDQSQLEALTEFIYNYQRYCLRHRLRPDL